MNRNKYLILILLIVVMGAFIRNYNIDQKGLFFYDEGVYLCSAKAKYMNFAAKLGFAPNISETDSVLKQHFDSESPNYSAGGKIGFVFLIVLSMLVSGINSYSAFLVSIFWGALTILLVYLIAKRIYDENTALLSALILAVSPMHILYSRCGLPQSASIFFLFLAFYLYLVYLGNKRYIYLALCAASVGFSITVHYNLLLMIPVFFVFEFLRLFFIDKGENKKTVKLIIFGAILVMPVFLWHAVTIADHAFGLGFYPWTYFGELIYNFSAVAEQLKYGVDPFFSLYFFQKMEGWLIFLLFICGVYFLIKNLRKNFNMPEFVLVTLALFPLVWYGFHPHMRVLRTFAPVLPAMAIVAAYAAVRVCGWEKIKKIGKPAFAAFAVTALITGYLGFMPILRLRSAYTDVIKYIYENNETKLVSNAVEMYPLLAYYMGKDVEYILKLDETKSIKGAKTLINVFTYNKELENITPYKTFEQVSFSAHNAEGGSKDKYVTKNIPTQKIYLYRVGDVCGIKSRAVNADIKPTYGKHQ